MKTINISLTDYERDLIDEIASYRGSTFSQIIRDAINRYIDYLTLLSPYRYIKRRNTVVFLPEYDIAQLNHIASKVSISRTRLIHFIIGRFLESELEQMNNTHILPQNVEDRLSEISQETKMSRHAVIMEAVQEYIDDWDYKNPKEEPL